jgi:hypothetical protein
MGIWDIFSGESGRNAAIWGAGQTASGANQQRNYINDYSNLSLKALGDTHASGSGALTGGYNVANAAQLGQFGSAADQLTQAGNYYKPLAEEANRGYSTYGDAAGVNGAAGQDRARQNFRAGPGYQFTQNEAVNAATRSANAAGMAASGNTLDATTRLGANLADKEWGGYMDRLNPYLQLAPGLAAKQADASTNIASLQTDFGKTYGDRAMSYGNTLANMAQGYGNNAINIYGQQGRDLANITGAETGSITNLGTSGMMAGQQGNANAWNAGMQIANLAANAMGGGKASSLFK